MKKGRPVLVIIRQPRFQHAIEMRQTEKEKVIGAFSAHATGPLSTFIRLRFSAASD